MANASKMEIRLVTPEDAPAIQRLVSDPAIAATTRIPHPYPEDGARLFVARHLEERASGQAYVFGIREAGQLVGACGLHGVGEGAARELGYWVGRRFWGRGYATFGVRRVLAFAFTELRLQCVGSAALESNTPSRRVLEKCGFELLGLKVHDDPLLKRSDERLAIYALTRERWQLIQDEVGPAPA